MAVYETQSASSASNDPASVVAFTPTGPSPHSSPASRPSLPGLWTHSPTSSSSGWPMIPRNAYRPTFPVLHWMTRYMGEHCCTRYHGRAARPGPDLQVSGELPAG